MKIGKEKVCFLENIFQKISNDSISDLLCICRVACDFTLLKLLYFVRNCCILFRSLSLHFVQAVILVCYKCHFRTFSNIPFIFIKL